MCIGNESSYTINQEVGWASMPGVLNLRDVLELIMNSLNDGSFPHHELVEQRHEFILHVPLDSGNQLNSVIKQELEKLL